MNLDLKPLLEQKQCGWATLTQCFNLMRKIRHHRKEMNLACDELMAILRLYGAATSGEWIRHLKVHKYFLILLLGCASSSTAHGSRLKSPRDASVVENVPMRKVKLPPKPNPLAAVILNSYLVWTHPYPANVNFSVWESVDLKYWAEIGYVSAPLNVDTPMRFDLPYNIHLNAPKSHAFWQVSAEWKTAP